MNNNDFSNDRQMKENTYRATSNLNTAIENPQININSAMGVNIKDVENDNLANTNQVDFSNSYNDSHNDSSSFSNNYNQFDNFSSNQFNNNSFEQNMNNTNVINNQGNSQFLSNANNQNVSIQPELSDNQQKENINISNQNVSYEPVMHEKKKQPKTVTVPRELKIMLFIIFILFIFILIMPYIYDFFKELQLVITTG